MEGEDPRWGRTFEYLIYALILLTVIEVTVETLPNLPDGWKAALAGTEIAIVAIFTVEYILRIITARSPLSYILSFWRLVDLIAIAPFYLSLGVFRVARTLRLLRLFRFIKEFRRAGDRIYAALPRGTVDVCRVRINRAFFERSRHLSIRERGATR